MRKLALASACLLVAALALGGCTTAGPTQFVTVPAHTVTLPGTTVTGVTTIPAVTTVLQPFTVTVTAPDVVVPDMPTLSESPVPIRSHALIIDQLEGTCLVCHGAGGPNEFPLSPEHGGPPFYDGSKSGSSTYPGIYVIVQDSLADHADRQATTCLSCHPVMA